MNNSKQVAISCIIPACDRREFLGQALDSILKQTFQPYEIIIVNNGRKHLSKDMIFSQDVILNPPQAGEESRDNEILRCAQDDLERITIYNTIPYLGASQARNFGASMAKGDYLAFLDDDDLWSPNYLENIIQAINQGSQCIVSRLDRFRNGKIGPYKNAAGKLTIKTLLTRNPGAGGTNTVISKKLFCQVHGFDPKLEISEDKSLFIELLKQDVKITTLSNNQAIYREHDKNYFGTNAKVLAKGIRVFVKKYSYLMGIKEYLYNWQKIYRYRYKSGKKLSFIPFVLLKIISKILKIL